MNWIEFINRTPVPSAWSEGDNIPWNEPGFSARMFNEHLSQAHDAASRRFQIIDQHVDWIHTQLLHKRATHILDLACGPGLYANRLARLGHTCTGIDYSPASIAYAIQTALQDNLPCTFIEQDLRKADFGAAYGLVMLIYGELNVFRPQEAREILQKAYTALQPGGRLLLEPHTFALVEKMGREAPSWRTLQSGLFSEQPHLFLQENFWDPVGCTATLRYIIGDGQTGDFTRYAQTIQAYTDSEYGWLLSDCGFKNHKFYTSLAEVDPDQQSGLIAITAQKD